MLCAPAFYTLCVCMYINSLYDVDMFAELFTNIHNSVWHNFSKSSALLLHPNQTLYFLSLAFFFCFWFDSHTAYASHTCHYCNVVIVKNIWIILIIPDVRMCWCDIQYSGCVCIKKNILDGKRIWKRERKYQKIITVDARCKHLVDRPSILCIC